MAKGGGIEVAQAYVTIVPSMEGSQKAISKGLNDAASKAGDEAGKKAGEGISEGVGKGGEEGAKKVGEALQEGTKRTVGSVANDVQGKISSAFSNAGSAITSRFQSIGAGIRSTFSSVGSAISGTAFGSHLVGAAQKVGSAFTTVTGTVAGVGKFIGSTFQGVASKVGSVLGPVREKIGSAFKHIKEVAGSAFEFIGDKAGDVFSAIGISATVGLAGVAAAFAMVTKGAFDNYASFQQLEGGISKLFGTAGQSIEDYARDAGKSVAEVAEEYASLERAQDAMMGNAQNAYRTMGLSANDYMSQVTSFSAALISDLGGDTEAAAEVANLAMTSMADNVSIFGSNVEDVQNAYQGFAKQNYSMLDNLKLGYGGTKTEMERLIADANELAAANGEAADMSIDSFADVVRAIQIIQEEQGIAGNAANEAGRTIEGSMNAAKAAWQNVLTELGKPDGDVQARMQEFSTALFGDGTESNLGVFGNAIPVVANIASGIVAALPGAMASIGAGIRTQLIPMLDEVTGGAASQVVATVEPMFTRISEAAIGFMEGVAPLAPVVGEIAEKIGGLLAFGINTAIGAFEVLSPVVSAIANAVLPALNGVLGGAIPIVTGVVDVVGRFASALFGALTPAINAVGPILATLGNVIQTVGSFIGEHVLPVAGDLAEMFGGALGTAVQVVADAFASLVDFLSPVGDMLGAVGGAIGSAWDFITGKTEESSAAVEEAVTAHTAAAQQTATDNVGAMASDIALDWETMAASASTSFEGFEAAVADGTAGAAQSAMDNVDGMVADVGGSFDSLNAQAGTAFSGMQNSVSTNLASAQRTASSATSAINNAFGTSFKSASGSVNSSLSSINSSVSSQLGAAVRTAQSMGQQMAKALDFKAAVTAATTTFNALRTGMTQSMQAVVKVVTDGVKAIQQALNVKLTMPTIEPSYIKLPHFSLNGKFDPQTGKVPSVSVSWYAKGGFPGFDGSADLFVAGERGGEMVWPSYSPYIDRYADALVSSMERRGGDGEVIAWLARNLGPVIRDYSPVATTREANRRIREAVA